MNRAPHLTPPPTAPRPDCASCPASRSVSLRRLGLRVGEADHIVALAGNPNTGKSTVFNALTGLRQHTGNWPGKTVTRAEGAFAYAGRRFKLVDLPGTYSLLSASPDEQIARDFILFGKPDVTIIVADATRLERNLNLVLQVLEITDRAVLCVNLVDEARRHGWEVDDRQLARDLGVPVVLTSARTGHGLPELLQVVYEVATGRLRGKPHRLAAEPPAVREAVHLLVQKLEAAFPGLPNARWVALRLLGGDASIIEAVRQGDLGRVARLDEPRPSPPAGAPQPTPRTP